MGRLLKCYLLIQQSQDGVPNLEEVVPRTSTAPGWDEPNHPSLLGLLADVESTCDSFLSTFGSRSDFKPVIFKKSGLQYFPTDSVRRLKTQDFVRLVRPPEATTIRWFEPLYGP